MSQRRTVRGLRAVASVICWSIAVALFLFAAGGFALGGAMCMGGDRNACEPRTLALVAGMAIAVAFGVVGALLWKPGAHRTRDDARPPWRYDP